LVVGVSLARAATNNISTAAGTGAPGFSGDGGAAAAAQISTPTDVAVTADGGYLITDQGNSRVRKVSAGGVISTLAGPANGAQLNAPNGLAVLADGSVLIADSNNNRVRKVSPGGTITTVAGNGTPGYNGDNIAAVGAALNFPDGLSATADGGYLIADNDNNRIRKVSAGGTITTVAGNGTPGYNGDAIAATSASLNDPTDVAATSDGGFLIADLLNNRVRKVSPGGTITTVAGAGTAGFGGDGGAATGALLDNPTALATTSDGGYLIADRNNDTGSGGCRRAGRSPRWRGTARRASAATAARRPGRRSTRGSGWRSRPKATT
jgi:sugar lactone lactonase YvrE